MKFLSIVLATLLSQAAAFPSGAGACPAGEAAPGGSHLTGMPGLVGPLSSDGEFVMTVGGVEVSNGGIIDASLDFDIAVTAAGAGFKGILIRVGGATVDQVTSTDLTAPAGACGDVGSVTHSNNSLKTTGSALVSLDADTPLEIDISVVVDNLADEGVSTFYYSSFQINAMGDDLGSPTPAPSAETGTPTTMVPVTEIPTDETAPPAMVTRAPTTMIPVTEMPTDETAPPPIPTLAPTTIAPTPVDPLESDPPSIGDPTDESDSPSMVPDDMSSAESDPPSLVPVILPSETTPYPETPTSDVLTYAGAAAAFTGAFLTIVF